MNCHPVSSSLVMLGQGERGGKKYVLTTLFSPGFAFRETTLRGGPEMGPGNEICGGGGVELLGGYIHTGTSQL
jgi:hypothetical protein